jgi:hypothetical protein
MEESGILQVGLKNVRGLSLNVMLGITGDPGKRFIGPQYYTILVGYYNA